MNVPDFRANDDDEVYALYSLPVGWMLLKKLIQKETNK